MVRNITILGATSHIAKGLIYNILQQSVCSMDLYTRSPNQLLAFLGSIGAAPGPELIVHHGYGGFADAEHDVIINCVGIGTARKHGGELSRYFLVTERYDNLVIEAMTRRSPEALYVALSSGAVYGEHAAPATADTVHCVPVNAVPPERYYAISRLNAEAKHRSLGGLSIVDLRVFAYFSRFADLDDGYFITELLTCLQQDRVLELQGGNFVRDYLHPDDLFAMVRCCMEAAPLNIAHDVCSAGPVEKTEILAHFARQYGLRTFVNEAAEQASSTGAKAVYCSENRAAADIGYAPRHSSMETLALEARHILKPKSPATQELP